jgi:hypothetical protein
MPEGTRLDLRNPDTERPVEPATPRLERATAGMDPRCAPGDGPLMTLPRFIDRFLYFSNLPQQQNGVAILYDEILAMPGGRTLLSEDALWALEYSNTPPPPPEPPKPTFSNPLQMVWQSQNDNLSGTGSRECFSSSMAMIAMFHGKIGNDDEYNKVRARFGDTTDPNAQLGALRSLGLTANYFQNGRSTDIEREINEGRPAGVGWLHHGPVSAPSGGGHWSVISGYTQDHWIHEDPNGVADMVNGGYTANWDGHKVKYTRRNFNPRWLVGGEGDGWWMQVIP